MLTKSFLLLPALMLAWGCEAPTDTAVEFPEHSVERTSLAPKDGQRVQVDLTTSVSEEMCSRLIDEYRDDAGPEGQVSVHMPSTAFEGQVLPFCVENFDGRGVQYNRNLF